MSEKTANRLTPFLLGAAIALVVVGTVVRKAAASDQYSQACRDCGTQAAAKGDIDCKDKKGSEQQGCRHDIYQKMCWDTKICPGESEEVIYKCFGPNGCGSYTFGTGCPNWDTLGAGSICEEGCEGAKCEKGTSKKCKSGTHVNEGLIITGSHCYAACGCARD